MSVARISKELQDVDNKAADPGKVDKRFLGLLEDEYSVHHHQQCRPSHYKQCRPSHYQY